MVPVTIDDETDPVRAALKRRMATAAPATGAAAVAEPDYTAPAAPAAAAPLVEDTRPASPLPAATTNAAPVTDIAFHDPAVPAYDAGTPVDTFAEQVQALYAKYGRVASQAEIDSHRGNPGGINAIDKMLAAGAGGDDSATQQASQVGHNGTFNGQTREQYRDALMGSGITNLAGLQAWLAQHGGVLQSNNGTVMTPFGESIDALIGARTGNGMAGWTGVGAGSAGAGALGAAGSGAGATAAGAPGTDFQSQIRQMLMAQLAKASEPVTADDPEIKNQMTAQERTLERTRQERRSASAERAASQGLLNGGTSSGAFDADLAAGYEDKGASLASVQAQLFSSAIQSKRTQLTALLQTAVQSGDNESARALQLQIAQMDDTLKRLGLQQSQSQFDDQYGLSIAQFQRLLNLDATAAKTG